jgi:hypothetical protein
MIYGDPHLIKFDGNKYSFNRKGHFWLVKTNRGHYPKDLGIQARLEQATMAGQ